ncbi:hypothetical protein BH09GEM1_BH09GEM1_10900 [soil metagenome]
MWTGFLRIVDANERKARSFQRLLLRVANGINDVPMACCSYAVKIQRGSDSPLQVCVRRDGSPWANAER